MNKLYYITFSEKECPHIRVNEYEVTEKVNDTYYVKIGDNEYTDDVRKWEIDNFDTGLNTYDSYEGGYFAYMWLSNNDRDSILKFENEVLKILNNRIVRLNNEMERFEKMKMLVGD